jgi:hypothetical protein
VLQRGAGAAARGRAPPHPDADGPTAPAGGGRATWGGGRRAGSEQSQAICHDTLRRPSTHGVATCAAAGLSLAFYPTVTPATLGPANPTVTPATLGPANPTVTPATLGPANPTVTPATLGPANPTVTPATLGPASPTGLSPPALRRRRLLAAPATGRRERGYGTLRDAAGHVEASTNTYTGPADRARHTRVYRQYCTHGRHINDRHS